MKAKHKLLAIKFAQKTIFIAFLSVLIFYLSFGSLSFWMACAWAIFSQIVFTILNFLWGKYIDLCFAWLAYRRKLEKEAKQEHD